MTRAHIFYSGIVQGVGFRYTTQRLAEDLDLQGWVRNLSDGRVEVVTEGPKEQIEQLMAALESRFEGSILHKDLKYSLAEKSFHDFRVI
ncbi:MAG: acylphosphatase [Candidatus Omnitrophica bacterium]|nr:acylphosphatase [Candidatus Omnitrophota bacterium]